MPLTQDQLLELQKLQKAVTQLESILKVSSNEEQRRRVSTDIKKYRDKMQQISPEGMPDDVHIASAASSTKPPTDAAKTATPKGKGILDSFPIMKISPSSNDTEINFIGTLVNVLDIEYLPILSDTHLKLDYSHATERDAVVKHMENMRRNLKVLTETIEEYAQAEKQEFREQLGRMKNKQSRIFISEAYDVFKKFKEFMEKLDKDMKEGGGVVMNIGEKIRFNNRFEKATLLEGKEISEAMKDFLNFTKEATEAINVPNMKSK